MDALATTTPSSTRMVATVEGSAPSPATSADAAASPGNGLAPVDALRRGRGGRLGGEQQQRGFLPTWGGRTTKHEADEVLRDDGLGRAMARCRQEEMARQRPWSVKRRPDATEAEGGGRGWDWQPTRIPRTSSGLEVEVTGGGAWGGAPWRFRHDCRRWEAGHLGRGAEEVNRDAGSRGRKRSRGEVARRTGEMGSRESGRRVQREGDGDHGDDAGGRIEQGERGGYDRGEG